MFDNLNHSSFPDHSTNFCSHHSSQYGPSSSYHTSSSSPTTRYKPEPHPTTTPVIPRLPYNGHRVGSPPVNPDSNATILSSKRTLQTPSLLPLRSPISRAASSGDVSAAEQAVPRIDIERPFDARLPKSIDEKRLVHFLGGDADELRIECVSMEDYQQLGIIIEGSKYAHKWEKTKGSLTSDGIMILEVPVSRPHEIMGNALAYIGQRIMASHSSSNENSSFRCSDFQTVGSADVKLTNRASYQPDWSLCHVLPDDPLTELYPTIIYECSYSQKRADVDRKAAEMVLFSQAYTKLAIVADYEFDKSSNDVSSVTWSHWTLASIFDVDEEMVTNGKVKENTLVELKEGGCVMAYSAYFQARDKTWSELVAKRSRPIQIYPADDSKETITFRRKDIYSNCDDETVVVSIPVTEMSKLVAKGIKGKAAVDRAYAQEMLKLNNDRSDYFASVRQKRPREVVEETTEAKKIKTR